MQREQKYQYWYSGRLLAVGQIEFFTDGTYRINDELVGGILREWTGLKDKNGKEIYEGDIVRVPAAATINGTAPVVFYRGSFGTELDGSGKRPWCLQNLNEADIEVIGNIYENPDLLN